MSGNTTGIGTEVGVEARLRSLFADREPFTTIEVADELAITTDEAADALRDLAATGTIASKDVGAASPVWYRQPDPEAADHDLEAIVEETVAAMDVPGTSEMMRDWRRDAIHAAVDLVRDRETVTSAELRGEVFPAHSAGYDEASAWWEMVRPRLAAVPGIDAPDDAEGVWQYVGQ